MEGYEFLNSNYPLIGDYYDIDGFKVFYGMEVTTEQKLDILIIGKPKQIIELRDKINIIKKDREYIDINELFKMPIQDELLVILAHPYRNHLEFPTLKESVVHRINAIEFNAKDLYKAGIQDMKDKVSKLASKLNLPIVCGSDTHYFIQMSSVKNILLKDCKTVEEIKKQIEEKNYHTEISLDLKVRVKSAIIIKKLICNKDS